MIPFFASPAVCVIDDDVEDYRPILDALMNLGLGCVHVRGDTPDSLPPQPFDALRVVFVDLHLSGHVGRQAASHTANVVRKVVPVSSGPILLIIWSKYAGDTAGDVSQPPEDQPTEADLFKTELLNSVPGFKTRLVFAEMAKPKSADRPSIDHWVASLRAQIKTLLESRQALEVVWAWEALIRNAGLEVSETLAKLTEIDSREASPFEDKLKTMLKLLSQRQGGPDCSEATIGRHLLAVFSQLASGVVETSPDAPGIDSHGNWLAETLDETGHRDCHARLNAAILIAPVAPSYAPFIPGTVYDVTNIEEMEKATGFSVRRLVADCFKGDPTKDRGFAEFESNAKPVVLEITPACDFHQGHRRSAILIAGLALPAACHKKANSKDACKMTPVFEDRSSAPLIEIGLVFCGRYRFTTGLQAHPGWLRPRFRLREMVVADFRNWHASQASRIGYLCF